MTGYNYSTCRFCALTTLMLVIPRTKHIASRIFDLPDPLRPVMELKLSSHPVMTVRTAYDLKPSMTTSTTLIAAAIKLSSRLYFATDKRNRNVTRPICLLILGV